MIYSSNFVKNLAIYGLVAAWIGGNSCRTSASELESRFRTEYPRAGARIAEYYGRIRGSGSLSVVVYIDGAKAKESRSSIRFALDSGRVRVERLDDVEPDQSDPSPPSNQEVVFVKNAKVELQVSRPQGKSDYLLKFIDKDDINTILSDFNDDYVDIPFKILGTKIEDIVSGRAEGFIVDRITDASRGGRALIRVWIHREAADHRGNTTSGWFELSPDEGWSMTRYEYKYGNGRRSQAGEVIYTKNANGFPVPSEYRYRNSSPRGYSDFTFIYDEIASADTPDRDFSLAAFGLESLGTAGERPNPNILSYFLWAVGAMAFIVAILLGRLRSHPAFPGGPPS